MGRAQREIIFGFDSAWTNSPKAPGAICAISTDGMGQIDFDEPELVSFEQALDYIERRRAAYDFSLLSIDQPTIVPNLSGSRPVDKIAASVVSWVGGGVQPANRSKVGMFCEDAPVWPFLSALDAREDPLAARSADSGHFVIEVFPALSLPGLDSAFARRFGAPKYNPQNKRKFRTEDWRAVNVTAAAVARRMAVQKLATWADVIGELERPRKSDQDKLDAAICALIGLLWRRGAANESLMIGDLEAGYMVAAVGETTRARLEASADVRGVSVVTPAS